MTSEKSNQSNNKPPESSEEMDIDESLRYVDFLLMWYRNRSSISLANTIVHEIEKLKQRIKACENGSKDEECQRLVYRAVKLFRKTKDFKISWQESI